VFIDALSGEVPGKKSVNSNNGSGIEPLALPKIVFNNNNILVINDLHLL